MKSLLLTLATLMTIVSSAAFGAGEYAEALRCYDRFSTDFGATNAATLCRGILNANATAVYNCADEAAAQNVALDVTAVLCQGIDYANASATWNCFSQAVEMMVAADAARLCQKTSYAVYSTKLNCLAYARDVMVAADAAQLCGGIAP